MKNRQLHKTVRNYNLFAILLAVLIILALVLRAQMIHFEYPDGKGVHVLTPAVTITADESGDRILFHGKLPQYFPAGSLNTEDSDRIHLIVELEDLGDSDELMIEVWNANMEARLDGELIGTYLDGNPIHSLSSYYYTIPVSGSDNGRTLELEYWRERTADIPWTFPEIKIGTSSELLHNVFFPYRLMIILASAMMYFSFTIIICLYFYRNRPGIQNLIYSFILVLLGTFQIISACPASSLVSNSNLAISLTGQIGIMAFPIFLYLFLVEDGSFERNPFFFLLAFMHLMLGMLDLVLLAFGISCSELDITIYLSATSYLVMFLVYFTYLFINDRHRIVMVDFISLILFTISSLYLSFLIISGDRNMASLYVFTGLMVVGLSICSYKTIIALTRNNVALLKKKTLEEKSYKDVLTGLGNRRALRNALDSMDLEEEGSGIGIVYFDINGMKRCNDTLGHEAGDKMLKTFATASRVSEGECYRIGGDEFVKIIHCKNEDEMKVAVENIQRDFMIMMDNLFSVAAYGCFDVVSDRHHLNEMVEKAEYGMRQNKKEGCR